MMRIPFGSSSRALATVACAVSMLVACGAALAAGAGYDPEADPEADLRAAVERAEPAGKHILLKVGGEWCGWCHRMEAFLGENEAVREALERNFEVVKINWSPENENEAFLSRYPEIHGFPHFIVLDGRGELLDSVSTGGLEDGETYSKRAFLAFVERYGPEGH